ncbi:MAG: hypothetical protein ACI93R_003403 [Flavobacteriales bacterium]|jgi:hypothetical protein
MKIYPEGFPLKPIDRDGNIISEGDSVKLIQIPDWLICDLDAESMHAVKSCEGTVMKIYEIDDYGYAWLEKVRLNTEDDYESNRFSMEPNNLCKIY